MKHTSTLCALFLLACSLVACSGDTRNERISTNLCSCEAAALGRPFTQTEAEQCEATVTSLLEKAPDSCVSCLDKTLGSSSAKSACNAAEASCTTCKLDAGREVAIDRYLASSR